MKRFSLIFSQVQAVLSAYRVRTMIAVIGVLLGAMALVIVQNVSLALNTQVAEDIKEIGDKVVTIFARPPRVAGRMMRRERIKTMKYDDVTAVLRVQNVMKASPCIRGSRSAKYLNSTMNSVNVLGVDNVYFELRGLHIAEGQPFTDDEMITREKVALLGSNVYKTLFGEEAAIGKTIFLGTTSFTVAGVFEEKGVDSGGNDRDTVIYIPVTTAETRLFNQNYLNEIAVQMREWEDFDAISADVSAILRIQHRIPPGELNDFEMINPINEEETSRTLIRLASSLGSASAALAFIIGSVGIFSLMLLIVNQRIVEVGIKRAIGATRSDILFQFLFESGYIGILGGVFGIFIGSVISVVISYFADLPFVLSAAAAFVGLFASILSGVAAGLYPAVKASRTVPVKALQV
ncbi:MAG: ABC transporter permease [Deferribacteraceae bacterium]|jgi:putative ABC transport system permease protein|nr:ABC transporter permease [Deferribacteraceae bacterium]